MTGTTGILARLCGPCNVLRDDSVTCNKDVTGLTDLLFLKMLAEVPDQNGLLRENRLPDGCRWGLLVKREGMEQFDDYKAMLLDLGKARDPLVAAILTDAQTRLRKPTNLKALTTNIDQLDWFSAREGGPWQPLRGPAGEEHLRQEVGRRAVLHAAPADRRHRPPHAAAAGRDGAGPGGGHGRLPCRRGPLHQGSHG